MTGRKDKQGILIIGKYKKYLNSFCNFFSLNLDLQDFRIKGRFRNKISAICGFVFISPKGLCIIAWGSSPQVENIFEVPYAESIKYPLLSFHFHVVKSIFKAFSLVVWWVHLFPGVGALIATPTARL